MEQWMYWVCSLVIAAAAFIFGRKDKADIRNTQEVKQDTTLDLNVKYIKESVDGMRLEQKDTNRKLEKQAEEFTEMKVKQADNDSSLRSLHKRMDRVEAYIDTSKSKEVVHD